MERDEVESKFVRTLSLVCGEDLSEELRVCLRRLPELSDLGELSSFLQRV
jgi:hypothetical protein